MIAIAAGMKFTSSAKKKSSNEKRFVRPPALPEVQFQLPAQALLCPNNPGKERKMLLEELSKIAAQNGNCRLVISYNGDDKYALGISDGVTTPLVINGTLAELQTAIVEKLPGYLELAARETAAKKAREEAARHEAELKAAEARRKQEAAARKAAEKKTIEENKAAQGELSLF